jgi:hypothetical protein
VTSFVEMHAPLTAVVVRREITRLFAKKAVNGLRQVFSPFHHTTPAYRSYNALPSSEVASS